MAKSTYTPPPSQAVLEARARDAAYKANSAVRIDWFIEEVSNKVKMTFEKRVRLATSYLRDKVVSNISRPVTKTRVTNKNTGHSYTRVTNRSKPGEFPKADITLLMKTIFSEVKNSGDGMVDGYVGTPLDYGVILELRLDRSFLVRTLNEERERLTKLLSGPLE